MSTPASGSHFTLRLPRRALRNAGIAFGIGLLLFLLVWLSGRNKDFYRADPVVAANSSSPLEPLPEPLAAGAGASDMPEAAPRPVAEETPQLVETVAPAPVPDMDSVADPNAVVDSTHVSADTGVSLAPGNTPLPIPGQSPQPRYPPSALRRGESGTVRVRVDVDAQGQPAGVALIQRSGSRDLDRAAMEVVRKWRFQPAQRDGKAVASSIEIPIDFNAKQ